MRPIKLSRRAGREPFKEVFKRFPIPILIQITETLHAFGNIM
jgi:hypothetical protein